MYKRTRTLRKTKALRQLVQDVHLSPKDLIYPLFIEEGDYGKQAIETMPGQFRYTLNGLDDILEEVAEAGIGGVILFGIPHHKDPIGTEAYSEDGIVQKAVRFIKSKHKDLLVITDVCMCEYTSHGHCGILDEAGEVMNDITLSYLQNVALSHVEAGADMVAPSDMMDGRVAAIRQILDEEGFVDTPIMSYGVKYASSFYGPFRAAADSAPTHGNRKGYQMDFKRKDEYLIEAETDIEEGADILIVKPATAYMDVIKDLSGKVNVPIACYHVSGEYAMIKAAGKNNWIDEKAVLLETLYGFKRAGASIIITYGALEVAEVLREGLH